MSVQQSHGYKAVQDKDLLLSEEGASETLNTASSFSLRQRVGFGLLLAGTTAAVAVVAMPSRPAPAGRASSTIGLQQEFYGYGVSQYGQAQAASPVQAQQFPPQAIAPVYPGAGAAFQAAPAAQYAPAAVFPAAVVAPAAPLPTGECGSAGTDCSGSMCCKDAGFQCFTKNQDFATCRAVCEPGMIEEGDEWECLPLGEPAPVADGPEQCAWSGENCIALKCCNDANMKCFQKDGYFAGCLFKPQDGWDNTLLGEFRGWHQVYEPNDQGPRLGTNLYCIAVKSPNARVQEDQLLQSAAAKSIGIYSCNDNDVFEGAAAARTDWKSISNTDIFISVWNQVKENGKFFNNDWTVKADPDCVFFGDRLQMHLQKLNIGQYDAVYIKNCDFKFRFQGSLEIFSEKAMEAYMKYSGMCSEKIGHEGGEDFYIMTCMDAMGVMTVEDDSILYDKYATGEHLVLDDVSACSDGWIGGFHPFRTVEVWNNCADAALQAAAASGAGQSPSV